MRYLTPARALLTAAAVPMARLVARGRRAVLVVLLVDARGLLAAVARHPRHSRRLVPRLAALLARDVTSGPGAAVIVSLTMGDRRLGPTQDTWQAAVRLFGRSGIELIDWIVSGDRASESLAGAVSVMANVALVQGRVTRPPTSHALADGRMRLAFELEVARPGERSDLVPVAWLGAASSAPAIHARQSVVVAGRVRRRHFRVRGGTAVSTELVAEVVLHASTDEDVQALKSQVAGRVGDLATSLRSSASPSPDDRSP